MNRFVISVLCLSTLSLAEAPKARTVALKDAIKNATDMSGKDGTPAEPGLDVSKMPFSPDSIRMVVTHHQPKVIQCYEDVLVGKSNPIEGTLMTWFVINADGMVSQAKVLKKKSTVHNEGLNDCVVAVLATMNFPKPTDGKKVPVEFPFNLTAVR